MKKTGSSLYVALLAVFVILSGSLYAEDLIEQQKRINKVRVQQLESEYRALLVRSSRVGAKDPEEAANLIQGFVNELKQDTVLADARRARMIDNLQARIGELEKRFKREDKVKNQEALKQAERANDQRVRNEQAQQRGQYKQMMVQYNKYIAEGNYAAALKLSQQMKATIRGNSGTSNSLPPSASVTDRIASTNNLIQSNKDLNAKRRESFARTMQDLKRSTLPPRGDVEFPDPEKWAKLTKARSPLAKLSAQDRAMLKALSTPIDGKFESEPFEDVINYLSEKFSVTIDVNEAGMEDVAVNYKTPVTVRAKGITLRSFLRKMLGNLGLAYYVKGGVIHVTSFQRAREVMSTRVYYLGDLAGVPDLRLPPLYNDARAVQIIQGIVNTIKTSVDPESWTDRGGKGTIAFQPQSMSLIIKQTAEVHFKLGGGRPLP